MFEKILRLHIKKLLKYKNIDKKRLNRYNESRISKNAFKNQKLLSTIKSTKEILFNLIFTSNNTNKRFLNLEKQDDNKSFVIDKNSKYKDLTNKNKKNNTNKNDTNKNNTNKNNLKKNYSKKNNTSKDNNNTRYKINDKSKNYKDNQILV